MKHVGSTCPIHHADEVYKPFSSGTLAPGNGFARWTPFGGTALQVNVARVGRANELDDSLPIFGHSGLGKTVKAWLVVRPQTTGARLVQIENMIVSAARWTGRHTVSQIGL